MFREQFHLTKTEEKGIRNICLFVVIIYIHAWFTAPSASKAPRNDLCLLKNLMELQINNYTLAQVALKKFSEHLWYLPQELVTLAFFDDGISVETKRNMARALNHTEADELLVKRAIVEQDMISSKKLEDFVSSNTLRFFTITGFRPEFLKLDVEMWEEDGEFKKMKNYVKGLKVVIDVAERGVPQMKEYNKLHTKNEEQKQFLLQVVQQHRRDYPDRKKRSLLK